jgi:hypothetical protein
MTQLCVPNVGSFGLRSCCEEIETYTTTRVLNHLLCKKYDTLCFKYIFSLKAGFVEINCWCHWTRSLLVFWDGEVESGCVTLHPATTKMSVVGPTTMRFICKNCVLHEQKQNVLGCV